MIAIGPLVFARRDVSRWDQLKAVCAMRYCAHPGCNRFVTSGRCRIHALEKEHTRHNYDLRRLYRTMNWRRLRALVILEQVSACKQCGRITDLEVDHIQKPEGNLHLFWSRANLQGLCPACHSNKTKRGF